MLLKIHRNLAVLNFVLKFPLYIVYSLPGVLGELFPHLFNTTACCVSRHCVLGFRQDESMHLFCCRCSLSLQPELCERMTLCSALNAKKFGQGRSEQSRSSLESWKISMPAPNSSYVMLSMCGHDWIDFSCFLWRGMSEAVGTRFAKALGLQGCSLNRNCILSV